MTPTSTTSAPSLPFNPTFTSTLTSLLATSPSTTSTSTRGRPRPSSKPSIFTAHNAGSHARAQADISSTTTTQTHARHSDAVDAATLHRSKRRLTEKARLYARMKRGEYVPGDDGDGGSGPAARDREENALVDFDRKWAEAEGQEDSTAAGSDDDSSRDSEDVDDDDDDGGGGGNGKKKKKKKKKKLVEYTDEYGRHRTGTRRAASRSLRRNLATAHAASSLSALSAHPPPPPRLLHGDIIQSSAFDPTSRPMETLARKRDRSPTPPDAVHYDAASEVRSKGVGFYAFSRDEGERRKEMEGLRGERERGEEGRREAGERRERRSKEVEGRRGVIAEMRGKRLAERFLDGLDVP